MTCSFPGFLPPQVITEINRLGFVGLGVSEAQRAPFFDQFRNWIHEGKHGRMGWMERHLDARSHPHHVLPDCRSVISLAYPYSPASPVTRDGYRAARYTEPEQEDYHGRLKRKTRALVDLFSKEWPGHRWRICVDTAPILERSFAHLSGMGFIGKNTLLILPDHGSYLYLAEIVTTAPLPRTTSQPMGSPCQGCSRCLDSCPTGALESPYRLDGSRCLSYLTIEHPGDVAPEVGRTMGNRFFGCDVCQEVCPLNQEKRFERVCLPATETFLAMGEREFKDQWGHTALARAGLGKIKSNIRAIYEDR